MIITELEFLFNVVNSNDKTTKLIAVDNIKYAAPKNININNNVEIYVLINEAIKIVNKNIDTYLKKINANIFVPYKNPSIEYIKKENSGEEYKLQLCYHQNQVIHNIMFSGIDNGIIMKPNNEYELIKLYKNHNMTLNGLPLN